jgi:hypothetical protein
MDQSLGALAQRNLAVLANGLLCRKVLARISHTAGRIYIVNYVEVDLKRPPHVPFTALTRSVNDNNGGGLYDDRV